MDRDGVNAYLGALLRSGLALGEGGGSGFLSFRWLSLRKEQSANLIHRVVLLISKESTERSARSQSAFDVAQAKCITESDSAVQVIWQQKSSLVALLRRDVQMWKASRSRNKPTHKQ